ncbi:hydroxymethylglutaryl-CoA lyase [Metabacillus sp. RGM 3146]|uniref:hydroxymethylglutaryl-CoA lyase n=1 Tax=Metabacillus sp. RGM 3146 TaxID=3401092 RepID=UPI003B99F384
MKLPNKATIIEVGPRDGLQNEKTMLDTAIKIDFIRQLKTAGFQEMELTSFVSPKWVPQMADAKEVIAACKDNLRNLVLAPNEKGLDRAFDAGSEDIAFFVGVSDTFNKKNINRSTRESLEQLLPLIEKTKDRDSFIRACFSTSFYCPYEGKISEDDVLSLCSEFVKAGADDLSVADTIGMASPSEVYSLFSRLKDAFPDVLLTAHFHDTRGMGLANVVAALQAGVDRFDSSAGGLGGCPFAPGASGNIATEDTVFMLHQMGIETGIDIENLLDALDIIEPHLHKKILSKQYVLHKAAIKNS